MVKRCTSFPSANGEVGVAVEVKPDMVQYTIKDGLSNTQGPIGGASVVASNQPLKTVDGCLGLFGHTVEIFAARCGFDRLW